MAFIWSFYIYNAFIFCGHHIDKISFFKNIHFLKIYHALYIMFYEFFSPTNSH
jgi:hypothetical protein